MSNPPVNPRFIKLPSGVVVNLSVVSQIVPLGDTLEVHFTGGDKAVLRGQDVEALRKKSGLSGLNANVKIGIFWAIIIIAVLLVYFAVRARA